MGMVLACLLVSAFLSSGCGRFGFLGSDKDAVEHHLEHAKKLYELRDYKGAIDSYENIIRLRPDYSDAYFQIGLIYYFNLNDYLNAAYNYQRFLQCSNPDAGKVELAKGFLENAKLQFAASIPNVAGQTSPELVRLRTENDALHKQVEDLKRDLVKQRPKPVEEARPMDHSNPATDVVSTPSPSKIEPTPPSSRVEPKTPTHSKTYAVKKGEGIQSIAEKFYGDRSKWREIMVANPKLKDPNHLVPGQVLILP